MMWKTISRGGGGVGDGQCRGGEARRGEARRGEARRGEARKARLALGCEDLLACYQARCIHAMCRYAVECHKVKEGLKQRIMHLMQQASTPVPDKILRECPSKP